MTMKRKLWAQAALLIAFALMGGMIGCSKKEPGLPMTKAEYTKAIVDHALATNCKIMVQSIVIVEAGVRKDDGSLPLKVRYLCLDSADTSASKADKPGHSAREETLQFHETKNGDGKSVWVVR